MKVVPGSPFPREQGRPQPSQFPAAADFLSAGSRRRLQKLKEDAGMPCWATWIAYLHYQIVIAWVASVDILVVPQPEPSCGPAPGKPTWTRYRG